MDRLEHSHATMEPSDAYDTRQSKQRASIKWLLSKAFNNRVPENLREPFYRDHEEQEHLKPPIIGSLANAELYCQALANIYSDPNYHSLNHWNILQTLSRKGAPVTDPPHCPLTETVLINTTPLKMNAHMAVMEAIMVLYAKEVVRWERVSAALTRFGCPSPRTPGSPATSEEGLLAWVRGACLALASDTPLPSSLQELCDGAALVSLVHYYCGRDAIAPDGASQGSGRPRSLQESLGAARALRQFCLAHLPHDIFHMEPEDLTYMRGSMKQNLIAMLADLFNVLEIHPAKCVKYPSSEGGSRGGSGPNAHGVLPGRCLPPAPGAAIPALRDSAADCAAPFTVPRSPSATQVHNRGRGSVGSIGNIHRSACSTPEYRSHTPPPAHQNEESFVVHRGKQVTTLSSLARQEEGGAAGRPSDWESRRGTATYAGRRSRRSSISDDSQLTVENFGGSQDQLNFLGRNPEKELATVQSGSRSNTPSRKISAPAGPIEQATPVRSSLQDARGSIQFFYNEPTNGSYNDEKLQKSLDRQYSQPHSLVEYEPIRRQLSSDTITLSKQNYNNYPDRGEERGEDSFYLNNKDYPDGEVHSPKMTFADLTKYRTNGDQAGIQLVYMQQGKDNILHQQHQPKKKNTPNNQTTWQQLKMQHDMQHANGSPVTMSSELPDDSAPGGESRLAEVRLALEERRRRIEADKRKAEAAFDRQRRALGHHAFLQAVTKNKGGAESTFEAEEAEEVASPSRPTALQDVPPELQNRRSDNFDRPYVENKRTPDYDGSGIEEYQHSIAKMNSNLRDIQNDIARLTDRQNQIQASQIYQRHYQNTQNIPYSREEYGSARSVREAPAEPRAVAAFGSTPHVAASPPGRTLFQPDSAQFYLHEQPGRRAWEPPRAPPAAPPAAAPPAAAAPAPEPPFRQRAWQERSPRSEEAEAPRPAARRVNGAARPPPPPRDISMEPQSISFIGSAEAEAAAAVARLNITSGSRTYRLPSPTRPSLARDSFERPQRDDEGFYVSFDDARPKRAKPPLRSERGSPRKEDAGDAEEEPPPPPPSAPPRRSPEAPRPRAAPPAALVLAEAPPAEEAEEMERKKERIMLLSLQRRQRQEAGRAEAEAVAAARRAAEEAAQERRLRRKEEQQRRRDAILQRHKLKKAIEEAEREGKSVDRADLAALEAATGALGGAGGAGGAGGTARLRPGGAPRRAQPSHRPARPNTIHVDGAAVERASDALLRASERSHRELSGYTPTMRRDYYRGSQDSLADRAGLYKDSPVEESRGLSPGSASGSGGSGMLGRRGSCKTSRERINEAEPPPSARGRSKYSTYQNNFKAGRKSTSLMNLCDSGLGRATPPRRAPSPGPGGRGALPSPSGAPPSLPPAASASALRRRLRAFDDDASDISSAPSSVVDYAGPRLYKQPATKSNRGIMLNAVEYCVFPGAVNREAKRRVLEEVARSDAKHFLVLFRDAGCQFRALYDYCPERDLVAKLYGTGPRNVNERMFDKFFKYNSGTKCFAVVHTKHLTVTIDAFTIHNSLWQGKKVHLPSKKDMALVI